MFKLDLHVHTAISYDAFGSPGEVLEAAKKAGLHGFAVTEHHDYDRSAVFLELAPRHDLVVFAGAEVGTRAGHLLVFSADIGRWNRFKGYLNDPQEVIDAANASGGAVVAAHPYRMAFGFGGAAVRALRGLAAIEGCNGANSAAENRLAVELAKAMDLPCTGGSDAHHPREIGRCYTVFDRPVTTVPLLVAALRGGRCRCHPAPENALR